MRNIFENYMFEQPILLDVELLNVKEAIVTLGIGGNKTNVTFGNTEGKPQGPATVIYTSTSSSDGKSYAMDVSFLNNGNIHQINKIYKNDSFDNPADKPPIRLDGMHPSNIIRQTT